MPIFLIFKTITTVCAVLDSTQLYNSKLSTVTEVKLNCNFDLQPKISHLLSHHPFKLDEPTNTKSTRNYYFLPGV